MSSLPRSRPYAFESVIDDAIRRVAIPEPERPVVADALKRRMVENFEQSGRAEVDLDIVRVVAPSVLGYVGEDRHRLPNQPSELTTGHVLEILDGLCSRIHVPFPFAPLSL